MNDNKIKGFVKPFQNAKANGGGWNLNLTTIKVSNDYINAEFLKGVSLWCDYDVDGRFIERTCSIDISENPNYKDIVKAIVDKFDGVGTYSKYLTSADNSVEVEFEFDGFTDKYDEKKDRTYMSVHVKNITLL